MLLPVLLALQLAGPDSLTVYHGRENQLSVAIPRHEATVTIDGNLDELAWSRSALLTGFSQFTPNDGIAAADSTEVLVWYSGEAIFFGIRAYEPHGQVHATLADRDRIFGDDNIQILLGTFNDGRQATAFMVNPFGIQADGTMLELGQGGATSIFGGGVVSRAQADLNPDFVFQSKGRLTDFGYEVEVRIPFKSLRFQSNQDQSWGLNLVRQVQHSGYEDSWAPARQSSASFLAQSGHLTGLRQLSRGLVLDIQPEVTARVDGTQQGNQWIYNGGSPDFGGNLRWGVTNDLTLNGTANPDFSQVESDAGQFTFDPRQALFFPEKRPFFLDGSEQFNFPTGLIYTRRIVQPSAAVKLTGKTQGFNLGLLSALDDRENSPTGDRPIYNILRLQRDVGANSRIGVVYTDKIDGHDYNRVLGIDGRLVFGRIYTFQGQLAGSRTRSGFATTDAPLWFARFQRNGRTFGMRYSINAISDEFRAQSGFIGRSGIVNATVTNSITGFGRQGSLVERFGGDITLNGVWKYDDFVNGRESQDRKLHFNSNASLRGGWQAQASLLIETFGYDPDIYSAYAVETPIPGGLDTVAFVGTPDIPNVDWVASLNTPEFSHFSANVFALYGHDENFFEWSSGELVLVNFGATWRPTDQIRLEATYQHQQVNRRTDGSLVDIQRIPRLKLEYQVSRPLFVRIVGEFFNQWTDSLRDDSRTNQPILIFDPGSGTYVRTQATKNNRLRADILVSYQPNPGTVFFAGYGSTLREPSALSTNSMRRTDDAFFVKASYLFRM
jgi:hypothetical protein